MDGSAAVLFTIVLLPVCTLVYYTWKISYLHIIWDYAVCVFVLQQDILAKAKEAANSQC